MSRTWILSPHLDDAVLSCFHLAGQPAIVINIFDALPLEDAPLTEWDVATGSSSARQRMIERKAEDIKALALTSWSAIGLGLYRPDASAQQIAATLAGTVVPADVVHVPAGIGSHPGHQMVLEAAAGLDCNLRMYADIPYATGLASANEILDCAPRCPEAWQPDLALPGKLFGDIGHAYVHRLDAGSAERKRSACACYESQMLELDALHTGAVSDLRRLALEVSWNVRSGR
jgi:hypothetical protein